MLADLDYPGFLPDAAFLEMMNEGTVPQEILLLVMALGLR